MSTAKKNADSASEATTETLVFAIDVLPIIREAQQQHGLRHGDYQRYRQYCTRKLERLRTSLHFAQAVRSKMQPKRVIDLANVTDVRYFHVPLFLAERAWSYAMQLKAEANTEPRKRFHMLSRLRKAVHHADELAQLAVKYATPLSPRSKLEIEAYAFAMRGSLAFERRAWTEAREALQLATAIYEQLAAVAPRAGVTSDSEPLYKQKCAELAVQTRFCAYQLGDQHAGADLAELKRATFANEEAAGSQNESMRALLSRLEELVLETGSDSSKRARDASADDADLEAFRAIVFFEEPENGQARLSRVPVTLENVRYFLLSLRDGENQSNEGEKEDSETQNKRALDAYENTLKRANDLAQELRDAKRQLATPSASKTQAAAAKKTPTVTSSDEAFACDALLKYVQLVKLAKTVERNQLILRSLKPADVPFGVSFTPSQDNEPISSDGGASGRRKAVDEAAARQQQLQQAAKLHDSIVQSLEEMLEGLPAVSADASTVAKDSAPKGKSKALPSNDANVAYERFRSQLRAQCAAHRALRYFCLAETFHGWRRHAEALFVSSFVSKHASEAISLISSSTEGSAQDVAKVTRVGLCGVLDGKRVQELREPLQLLQRVSEVQRYLYAAQYEAGQAGVSAAPQLAVQQDVAAKSVAVPGFLPLPPKPLFYDLAANALTYEPVAEAIASAAQPAAQKKAGGISGFVKGWLWGSAGSAK